MPEHPDSEKVHAALLSAAKEFEIHAKRATHDATRECAQMDADNCTQGANLIKALDTEVFRLRQAIGHFLYGKMSRHDLRKITETWNT